IRLLGNQPIDSLLYLGTGTGRILELLSGLYRRAIGVYASRDMLSVARANLDKSRITKSKSCPSNGRFRISAWRTVALV
ncbi:hypothetical protein ACC695_40670, partial [Rhizobium ruizarguesonis]